MVTKQRIWTTFVLVFLGIVISYIDRGNLSLAAASIMRDLEVSPASMGILLSAFFWTYGLFQLPAGYLIDRVGIRLVYAVAFTLWSLASASIALDHRAGEIMASRLCLGLAESVGPLASVAFIRRYFRSEERGLPTALYISGQALGPAVGTFLGASVLTRLGWRPLFALTGLLSLAWVPLWVRFAPRSTKAQSAVTDELPVKFASLAMEPQVWMLACAIFFASYFWWFVMTWMPGYLTLSRGLSTQSMGSILSIPLFAMTLTNLASGWFTDRLVRKTGQAIRPRAIVGSLGLIGSAAVLLLNSRAVPLLPVLLTCICGFGMASASFWTIAQSMVPASVVARFTGFLNTVSQVAGAAAPLITGWSVSRNKNFQLAIWCAGIAPLIASACLAAIATRTQFQHRMQTADTNLSSSHPPR